MSPSERTRTIMSDPCFRKLASGRAKLRWSLSIVTIVMFFGFIVLISTQSAPLGATIAGGTMTAGMALALGMVATIVGITGLYVHQSNNRFDVLNNELKRVYGR
jgi:uncharacterized membrane protein (DUF485 family)